MRKTSTLTRLTIYVSAGLMLASCAASRSSFIQSHRTMDDVKVCRNVVKDADYFSGKYTPSTDEMSYFRALKTAKDARKLSVSDCRKKVKEADNKIAAGILAAAAVAVAVDAAQNSAGSGYNSYGGYAWDLIDHPTVAYSTIYVCRNKSNGQFAEARYCANLAQNDLTWPGT